jgi:hypothetical protein
MSMVETSETAPTKRKYERKPSISGIVRLAIEAMVWDGLPRAQAAVKAGISEHGLYKAFRKPPVKAAYLAELEVLRTSERARNIHTLLKVRDQEDNQMARVQAVSKLEQLADEQSAGSTRSALPGLVVQINVGTGIKPPQAMTEVHSSRVIDNADSQSGK